MQSDSSVPVQELSSTKGLTLNGKRSLMPYKLNYNSFVHDNLVI